MFVIDTWTYSEFFAFLALARLTVAECCLHFQTPELAKQLNTKTTYIMVTIWMVTFSYVVWLIGC